MSAQNDTTDVNKPGGATNVLVASTGGTSYGGALSVWDCLRLRLKKNANRVVSIKALTNEFGELVGFVVDDAQVIEGGKAG